MMIRLCRNCRCAVEQGVAKSQCRSDTESYKRDGGRSAGVGYQKLASNQLKRPLLRVMVVSIEVKLDISRVR